MPGTLSAARTWTIKGRLKAAAAGEDLPTQGRIRFVPSRGYDPATPLRRGPENGYLDRFDSERKFDNVKGEWDVQLSRQGKAKIGHLSNSGAHVNVSPDGRVTHGVPERWWER